MSSFALVLRDNLQIVNKNNITVGSGNVARPLILRIKNVNGRSQIISISCQFCQKFY